MEKITHRRRGGRGRLLRILLVSLLALAALGILAWAQYRRRHIGRP